MSLKEIFFLNNQKIGMQVRFKYWDHSIKYFTIERYDEQNGIFLGRLNTGEAITYHEDITDWKVYYSKDEECLLLVA